MHGAPCRPTDVAIEAPEQQLADLARALVRFLALDALKQRLAAYVVRGFGVVAHRYPRTAPPGVPMISSIYLARCNGPYPYSADRKRRSSYGLRQPIWLTRVSRRFHSAINANRS